MYTHCLFCQADLGANERVEPFPVGRRLAFDAARGRLWVVCRACERWNLSPLESRWEAIEACERLFRDTRRRVSTDNVGLARLADGLELVRIGEPRRPEFAAWRYGDQFARRRRRHLVQGGGALAAGAALVAGGPLLGAAAGTAILAASLVSNAAAVVWAKRSELLLPHPEEGQLLLAGPQLHELRLLPRPDGAWALEVAYQAHRRPGDSRWERFKQSAVSAGPSRLVVEGAHAERIAGMVLPRINGVGARSAHVQDAVGLLEDVGDPARYFAHAAARTREWGREQRWGDTGAIRFLPRPVRLALEMAAHEDAERRAMEGELAQLEAAWRDAEEIAAIADDLLLPDRVTRSLARLRGGV